MAKTALLFVVVLLVLGVVIVLARAQRGAGSHAPIHAKPPLTKREQAMHFRLAATFPEHVVLSQVAFSALLRTSRRATRNRFDRKVADFVLCDRAFTVLAVIELDDSSHAGRERQDRERDRLLTDAGYRVVRYAQVPDADRVLRDLVETTQQSTADETAKVAAPSN